MHAEIYQRSAAGLFFSGKPPAFSGDTSASYPTAAAAVNFAGFAVGYKFFKRGGRCGKSVISHYHQQFSACFRGFLHFRYFLNAYRVRLFAEYVKSFFQSRYRYNRMQIIGSADIYSIRFYFFQHHIIVAVNRCGIK